MEETVINIDKACRICMRDTMRRLKSIFTRNDEYNLSLADMIGECSSNQVDERDGLPSLICSGCEQELKVAYNFRSKCDESYKALHNCLKRLIETQEEEEDAICEVRVEVKVEDAETHQDISSQEEQKMEGVIEEMTDVVQIIEDNPDEDNSYTLEELAESEVEEEKNQEKQLQNQELKKIPPVKPSPDLIASLTPNQKETLSSYETLKDTEKNQKYYQCKLCEKCFTRQTHVKRHMLTHSNIKAYKCQHCDKCFSRSDHLQKHTVLHTTEQRSYSCEFCHNKVFSRIESLKNHMKRHTAAPKEKNFICETCRRAFSSQKYLDSHILSHNTTKKLVCKFCPEIFEDRKDLQMHNKLHINERPFLCSECGQRFLRNDYLVIHMRRHKGEKPYKCKFCEKCFPRATDLTVHERYHTDAKTHLCNTCGKGFHRAYNLLVHMRVHTGEKPYKCPHCTKCFAQGNDLKAHVRRHTGERFKCEICNKGFIQGYHLTNHKRDIHGIDERSHIRRLEKFKTQSAQQIQVLYVSQQEQLAELMRQKADLEQKQQQLEATIRLKVDSKIQETDQQISDMQLQLLDIEEQRQRILMNQVTQEQYEMANAAMASGEQELIKLENDIIEISVETQVE